MKQYICSTEMDGNCEGCSHSVPHGHMEWLGAECKGSRLCIRSGEELAVRCVDISQKTACKPINPWREHKDYPVEGWQAEVIANDTRLGYQDWVTHQREAADHEV